MNFKEIKELISIIQESNFTKFSYKKNDIELEIETDKAGIQVTHAAPVSHVPMQQLPSQEAPPMVTPKTESAPAEESDSLVEIKSPIVGTFYRSSGPDKEVFVKVGDVIEVGKVVCIVEAMKLFNEIESEISGKIVKVLVDDATPVEYDQPLFLVES